VRLSEEMENKAHHDAFLFEININFEKEKKRREICPITFEHRHSVKSIVSAFSFSILEFKIPGHPVFWKNTFTWISLMSC